MKKFLTIAVTCSVLWFVSGYRVMADSVDSKNDLVIGTTPDLTWHLGDQTLTVIGSIYSCLPDEEMVMRGNFQVGCAKNVHPPQWHN